MKKILLLFVVFGIVFSLFGCDLNSNNSDNPTPNQGSQTTVDNPTDDSGSQTTVDPAPITCETDDDFAEYILGIYKAIAGEKKLYKSTVGDVSAPKLSVTDVEERAESFKTNIKISVSNPDVVISVTNAEGKRIYVFNPEKVLNINGVGTHMGDGFPDYAAVERTQDSVQAKYSCMLGQ